jgi:hypothetical protein
MMQYMPANFGKRIEDRRRLEARQYAANWRLWQLTNSKGCGWWSRQRSWLLVQLGHAMVEWGRRLESWGMAPPA